MGTVQIGMDKESTCIPGNAMLTVPGNASRIEKGQLYIVEQAAHHNLPHGLMVNRCCVTPMARRVQVILINTMDQNIWVRQPLLAAELFELEVELLSSTAIRSTMKGMKLSSHSCCHIHMKTENMWRIMWWR